MLQRTFIEANNNYKWLSMIGAILVSPALATLLEFIMLYNAWDPTFGDSLYGSPRPSDGGAESFMLILGVLFYVVPCLVVGIILILISAVSSGRSAVSKIENKSNPNPKLPSTAWRTIVNFCQTLGLLLLASWIHLPIYMMYFKLMIDALKPVTVLGLLLLVIGIIINAINRPAQPATNDSLPT